MTTRRFTTGTLRTVSVLAIALAGLVLAAPAQAAACGTTSVQSAFAGMVNATRVHHHLRPLRVDVQVTAVADYHSREMLRQNAMVHTNLNTLGQRITGWTSIGENIGYLDYATSLSPRSQAATIFRMFMNSPTHRANILRPSYRYQGIGVEYAGSRMWITHNFEGGANPGTGLRGAC